MFNEEINTEPKDEKPSFYYEIFHLQFEPILIEVLILKSVTS